MREDRVVGAGDAFLVRDVSCTADQCFCKACSLPLPPACGTLWLWCLSRFHLAEVWQDLLPAVEDRRRMLVVRGVQVEGQNLW